MPFILGSFTSFILFMRSTETHVPCTIFIIYVCHTLFIIDLSLDQLLPILYEWPIRKAMKLLHVKQTLHGEKSRQNTACNFPLEPVAWIVLNHQYLKIFKSVIFPSISVIAIIDSGHHIINHVILLK